MRLLWGVISFVVLLLLIYLVATAVIHVSWVFGWGLLSVLVFLLIFEVLDDVLGFGLIGALIVAFILMEILWW